MSQDERGVGAASCVHRAVVLTWKARELEAKARGLREQAASSVEVAVSLARGLDRAEIAGLLRALRHQRVPGRQGFVGLLGETAFSVGDRVRFGRGDALPKPPNGVQVVYVLMDDDSSVLYVGVTGHYAARMPAHKDKPWTNSEVYVCSDRVEAVRLEGDLIFQHQPPFNSRDRSTRRVEA